MIQKLYFISGLGANRFVFERLKIDLNLDIIYIDWIMPEIGESIQNYAYRMSHSIDKSSDFGLIGLSFGGIICAEITRYLSPKFIILLSSVSHPSQIPNWLKFNRHFKLIQRAPWGFLSRPIVLRTYNLIRKIFNIHYPDLTHIYSYRDPHYIRWAIDNIVFWQGCSHSVDTYHIHGTYDFIFPIGNIYSAPNLSIIPKGSHMMVYEKPIQISHEIINIIKHYL